jgi:transmembrane sensor
MAHHPISWQLLAKYLANETSDAENQQIAQWLRADSRNHDILHKARQVWDQSPHRKNTFDPEKGWTRVRQAIEPPVPVSDPRIGQGDRPAPRQHWLYASPIRIAASIALVIGLFYLAYWLSAPANSSMLVESYAPAGQQMRLTLPDGTQIRLLAESRLVYPRRFKGNFREVQLVGEAFFTVSPRANQPFIVHTPLLATTVLGTSFHVLARPDEDKHLVAVASGKVQVRAQGPDSSSVILQPNESAVFQANSGQLTRQAADPVQLDAWQSGELYFQDEPLEKVVPVLERWYGVRITFASESIRNCLLTARFRNENLRNVLESIRLSADIDFQLEEKRVTLRGKGCP